MGIIKDNIDKIKTTFKNQTISVTQTNPNLNLHLDSERKCIRNCGGFRAINNLCYHCFAKEKKENAKRRASAQNEGIGHD